MFLAMFSTQMATTTSTSLSERTTMEGFQSLPPEPTNNENTLTTNIDDTFTTMLSVSNDVQPDPTSTSSSLVIVIVVVGLFVLLIVASLTVYVLRRRRKQRRERNEPIQVEDQSMATRSVQSDTSQYTDLPIYSSTTLVAKNGSEADDYAFGDFNS